MDILNENATVPYSGTAVALGDFDGLHIAHTAIIKNGIEYARQNGLKSGVLLFNENTKSVLEGADIKLITPNGEKIRLIDEMGADFVYIVNFDREFMKKTPEEFIEFLVNDLKIKAVFAGFDYKFGKNASGDALTLKKLGEDNGFFVGILPEMKVDDKTLSSSHIRQLIEDGNVSEASKYLGRDFSVSGTVEKGFQNGRKLGFPTANVSYDDTMLLPQNGVYAGYTFVDGKKYKSVINIGNNPTFGAKKVTIESHIIDFDGDIYGECIRVSFKERLRGDIKFNGIDELKERIAQDTKTAKSILL